MARAALTVQTPTSAGLAATYTAATVDGHAFDNSSGKVLLHVKNAGASPTNVTIDVAKTVDGLVIPDLVVAVANATEKFIGPFNKSLYNQDIATPDIAEAVLVNTSNQTSVTYAAIKLS